MDDRIRRTDGTDRSWLAIGSILAVVILGYGLGPVRVPLYGEETCRALHGIEMAETGDWLVATNQMVPILDRPPLQYWVFALVHRFVHELDPLTLRLFMVAVTACTALLVWWYVRRFLSDTAALIAGVAYPTIGHVFDLGRRAETDALLTLLVAASWMVWHVGHARAGRPVAAWTAGCALAALATLTKGLHGAFLFFAAVYAYLVLRREWRALFRWSHALGLVAFAAVIAAWQVPFFLRTGWEGTRATWLDPVSGRMVESTEFWIGLYRTLEFPVSVFGAALPWSLLLLGLAFRPFRDLGGRPRACVTFAMTAMVVVFAPMCLVGGGLRRYVMPMYPMLAVVCGAFVDRAVAAIRASGPRRLWIGYVRTLAIVLIASTAVFALATIAALFSDARPVRALAQPWWTIGALVVAVAFGTRIMFLSASSDRVERAGRAALLAACLLAAVYNGPVMNAKAFEVVRIAPQVEELRRALPPGARLYSFLPAHHRFAYWYRDHIEMLPWPAPDSDLPEDLEYFVVTPWPRLEEVVLPFAWETVAWLNMDRTLSEDPDSRVLIGRRVRAPAPGGERESGR